MSTPASSCRLIRVRVGCRVSPRCAAGCSGCRARPTLESVGECTDVLVAKQPRYPGNRQAFITQMSVGEIKSQILQDAGEGQALRRKPAGERSLAHAKLAGDLADACFAGR